jgi:hypothetical protein
MDFDQLHEEAPEYLLDAASAITDVTTETILWQ